MALVKKEVKFAGQCGTYGGGKKCLQILMEEYLRKDISFKNYT